LLGTLVDVHRRGATEVTVDGVERASRGFLLLVRHVGRRRKRDGQKLRFRKRVLLLNRFFVSAGSRIAAAATD
jgi:hypothetical protein